MTRSILCKDNIYSNTLLLFIICFLFEYYLSFHLLLVSIVICIHESANTRFINLLPRIFVGAWFVITSIIIVTWNYILLHLSIFLFDMYFLPYLKLHHHTYKHKCTTYDEATIVAFNGKEAAMAAANDQKIRITTERTISRKAVFDVLKAITIWSVYNVLKCAIAMDCKKYFHPGSLDIQYD